MHGVVFIFFIHLHDMIINYEPGRINLYKCRQEQKDIEIKNTFLVSTLRPIGITQTTFGKFYL
jgi:hypothetical protein